MTREGKTATGGRCRTCCSREISVEFGKALKPSQGRGNQTVRLQGIRHGQTSDLCFSHQSHYHHLQKFSDDSAIIWLGCPLDSVQVVGESRMMDKLSSLLVMESRPLPVTISALGSSVNDGLIHSNCVKQRYHRSFLPAAVRLSNQRCSQKTSHVHYAIFCNNWTIAYFWFINTNTLLTITLFTAVYMGLFLFLTSLLYCLFFTIIIVYCNITVLWLLRQLNVPVCRTNEGILILMIKTMCW